MLAFPRNNFHMITNVRVILVWPCLHAYAFGHPLYLWGMWPNWIYCFWPIERPVSVCLYSLRYVFQILHCLLLIMLVCVIQHLCIKMLAFTHAFSHTSLGQCVNLSPHLGIMSLGLFVSPSLLCKHLFAVMFVTTSHWGLAPHMIYKYDFWSSRNCRDTYCDSIPSRNFVTSQTHLEYFLTK